MNKRITIALVAFYIGVAVTTFGHAFNRNTYAHFKSPAEPRMYSALFCAAGWPLYWSVVLQSK